MRSSPRPRVAPGRRRGFALVTALALMALSAALLIAALAISHAHVRSVRTERAAYEVEAGARRALASALVNWTGTLDSLTIGTEIQRELVPQELGALRDQRSPTNARYRVRRLSAGLYVVAVDVSIASGAAVARRRLRLLVTRPEHLVVVDTTVADVHDSAAAVIHVRGSPMPIGRWSVADLY